jgi:hypothetical protein
MLSVHCDTWDVPNKYNYANDNPLGGIDRNGHVYCDVGICRHGGGGIGLPVWNRRWMRVTRTWRRHVQLHTLGARPNT